jgi:hypothetical protein
MKTLVRNSALRVILIAWQYIFLKWRFSDVKTVNVIMHIIRFYTEQEVATCLNIRQLHTTNNSS